MERKHSKTIKDVVELFAPYLTEEDVLEVLEEMEEMEMTYPQVDGITPTVLRKEDGTY